MDFAEYVARRRPTLFRSAVLLGLRPEDADDLVQATLTRCLRHWSKVEGADNPDAYVYRMLVNAYRDARARRWTGEVPTEVLPDVVVSTDLVDGLTVRQALAALTEEHREVLVLRFYSDLSERETARVLGIPAGTVKSRTARALAALSQDPDLARSNDAH